MSIPLLYEDDACFVINKPAGITVHPGSGTGAEQTLIDVLRSEQGNDALQLVHRLDKETTGCLLVAKDVAAHEALQKQFKDRTIRKTYLAVVHGRPKDKKALIDAAIGRSLTNRTRMSVLRTGSSREAVTMYEILQTTGAISLLRCEPSTGRTHQIRVHLAAIGHPILGDDKYGSDASRHQSEEHGVSTLLLHAAALKFVSPATGKEVEVMAEAPEGFQLPPCAKEMTTSCPHPICNAKKNVPNHIMKKWKREGEDAVKEGRIYDSVEKMFKDILAEKDDATD